MKHVLIKDLRPGDVTAGRNLVLANLDAGLIDMGPGERPHRHVFLMRSVNCELYDVTWDSHTTICVVIP